MSWKHDGTRWYKAGLHGGRMTIREVGRKYLLEVYFGDSSRPGITQGPYASLAYTKERGDEIARNSFDQNPLSTGLWLGLLVAGAAATGIAVWAVTRSSTPTTSTADALTTALQAMLAQPSSEMCSDTGSNYVLAFQNAWNAAGKTPPLVASGVYGTTTSAAALTLSADAPSACANEATATNGNVRQLPLDRTGG